MFFVMECACQWACRVTMLGFEVQGAAPLGPWQFLEVGAESFSGNRKCLMHLRCGSSPPKAAMLEPEAMFGV